MEDPSLSSGYVAIGSVSATVDGVGGVRNRAASSKRRQYIAAVAATMGSLVMGTSISWSGPALPLLQLEPAQDGFSINKVEASWVGSLMPLGGLLGGQLGGLLMSKLGRKGAMLADAGLFAVSFLIMTVAPSIWCIYVGRFLSGIATGISSLVCPVYVAETATPEVRGLLGSCVQLMVTIGVLLAIVVGAGDSWRWLTIACLAAVVLWSLLLLAVPETPAHHLANKRYREARQSLEWLRGTVHVDAEYEDIQRALEDGMARAGGGLADLVRRENLVPLIISLYLMLGQQLSGMNAVIFYVVDIFEAAGSSLSSTLEAVIVGVVQVVATVLAALVMDKLGRRMLLNLSSFFMVISIAVLGAFFYIKQNLHNTDLADRLQVLPVASLSIFVFAFSIGFGPIPWLMMSELFSDEVKGPASAIATTFNWTLAFLVTKFFSDLVAAFSEAGSFWVFGGITGLTFLFCLLFVPETKGKSLSSIQGMFRSSRPYFLDIDVWRLCGGRTRSDEETLLTNQD